MTSDIPHQSGKGADKKSPEWANGLRQLYDSVVEEALPDSFIDLLTQLDCQSDGKGPPPPKGEDRGA